VISSSLVHAKNQHHVAFLTLKDEAGKNRLSKALIQELNEALQRAEADETVRCICLMGHEHFFSVGAHLKEVQSHRASMLAEEKTEDFIAPWEMLSHSQKPVIVGLRGYVMGGGLELALMGDILCASSTALFSQPEIKLGLMPGGGGTQRLTQALGYHHAMDMCLTGAVISGQKALDKGLIQYIFEEKSFEEDIFALCKTIASYPLNALKAIKASIKFHNQKAMTDGLRMERELFYDCLKSTQAEEGLRAFFEKRPPVFE
jgi:enoyl-CoA hydratase